MAEPFKAAEKRRLFARLASIRELVFGMQDGVLTTAGVVFGLSGAVSGRQAVILAALAATAAGALSMGAGAYLGTRAEVEVMRSEIERTRRQLAREPYVAQESLLEELAGEGLSREAAYRVVKLLSEAPSALRSTTEAKIFGLGGASGNAILDGVTMFIAFLVGAIVPLLPYILVPTELGGLIAALAATALVLFAVGYFEGWMADRERRWPSGVRFLGIALGAAVIGYLIGLLISPLGGGAG